MENEFPVYIGIIGALSPFLAMAAIMTAMHIAERIVSSLKSKRHSKIRKER